MTNTLFIFKNMELFKNLSSLIFPVNTFFYKNLLSLAWKNLGSYTRGFTVQGAFSLQVFKYGWVWWNQPKRVIYRVMKNY